MKVLHLGKFYPPTRGGMETHLRALATGLRDAIDVEVAVAAGDQPPGRAVIDGVRVHRLRTHGIVAATPLCAELFTIVRDVRPDVLHIHHPHPLAMLAYLAGARDIPCVVSYHCDIVRQRVLRRLVAPVIDGTLARCAAILVSSPGVADGSRVLARFRHKCHLVPYGSDTSGRDDVDPQAVAALRARYGPRLVLAVGRLTQYKGFEFLVRAMRHVDGTLLLAGDGRLRASLERLIEQEQVGGRVILLGNVDSVLPYYEACDVFVLPSISAAEGFGLVQLEAMAAGKPVVNTALDTGVTFASPTGVCAVTVPPRDVMALAEAVQALLDDPARAARLGAAGRERVASEFSVPAMVERTLAVYRQVAAAGQTEPAVVAGARA